MRELALCPWKVRMPGSAAGFTVSVAGQSVYFCSTCRAEHAPGKDVKRGLLPHRAKNKVDVTIESAKTA
jgi:hypothetical protein